MASLGSSSDEQLCRLQAGSSFPLVLAQTSGRVLLKTPNIENLYTGKWRQQLSLCKQLAEKQEVYFEWPNNVLEYLQTFPHMLLDSHSKRLPRSWAPINSVFHGSFPVNHDRTNTEIHRNVTSLQKCSIHQMSFWQALNRNRQLLLMQ